MTTLIPALCALVLNAAVAQEPSAAAHPTSKKWALLIGVREYPRDLQPEFAELFGPGNDVIAVGQALRQEFQFDDSQIHTLLDRDATLANVLGEFANWLIPNVASGDVVFVYFAGHGSLVPDLAKGGRSIEPSDSDSTLVLWDSRRNGEKGALDFTDDELQSVLAPLITHGAHLFVVTDACHSEGGTRGKIDPARAPVRAAPRGSEGVGAANLPACWPRSIPFLEDRDPMRPRSDASVHFGACGKDEQAFEYLDPANPLVGNGVFTLVFLETLAQAARHPDEWTYDDLHMKMSWRMPSYRVPQTPVTEGSTTRVLFDGQYRAPPGRFRARLQQSGVVVEAGEIVGVGKGTRLRILERGGAVLGIARVERVSATTSFGVWETSAAKQIDGALYADWDSAPAGAQPLAVFDPSGELERFLGRLDFVQFDHTPRYYCADDADRTLVGHSRRARLVAPDGVTVFDSILPAQDADDADAMREYLRARLQDELSFNRILELPAVECDLKIEASFREPTPDEIQNPDFKDNDALRAIRFAQPTRGPEYRCAHPRSLNDHHLGFVEFTNRSAAPVYIYVLSLMPDHTRRLIYPSGSGSRDNKLRPDDTDGCAFVISLPPEWQDDQPYLDQYIVIATTESMDTDALFQRSAVRGRSGTPVPHIIEDALRGSVQRGGSVAGAVHGFGVAGLKLWIDPEPESPPTPKK